MIICGRISIPEAVALELTKDTCPRYLSVDKKAVGFFEGPSFCDGCFYCFTCYRGPFYKDGPDEWAFEPTENFIYEGPYDETRQEV